MRETIIPKEAEAELTELDEDIPPEQLQVVVRAPMIQPAAEHEQGKQNKVSVVTGEMEVSIKQDISSGVMHKHVRASRRSVDRQVFIHPA